jgi:hypothetical protein
MNRYRDWLEQARANLAHAERSLEIERLHLGLLRVSTGRCSCAQGAAYTAQAGCVEALRSRPDLRSPRGGEAPQGLTARTNRGGCLRPRHLRRRGARLSHGELQCGGSAPGHVQPGVQGANVLDNVMNNAKMQQVDPNIITSTNAL